MQAGVVLSKPLNFSPEYSTHWTVLYCCTAVLFYWVQYSLECFWVQCSLQRQLECGTVQPGVIDKKSSELHISLGTLSSVLSYVQIASSSQFLQHVILHKIVSSGPVYLHSCETGEIGTYVQSSPFHFLQQIYSFSFVRLSSVPNILSFVTLDTALDSDYAMT